MSKAKKKKKIRRARDPRKGEPKEQWPECQGFIGKREKLEEGKGRPLGWRSLGQEIRDGRGEKTREDTGIS